MTRCQESKSTSILRKFKVLHWCLEKRDCIAMGLMSNVDEANVIKGKSLGPLWLGVLMNELLFLYGIFLSNLNIGSNVVGIKQFQSSPNENKPKSQH